MKKYIIIFIMFVTANLCLAQTISTSSLNGTRWKLNSPTSDYRERYMSFSNSYRTTETKFIKENK